MDISHVKFYTSVKLFYTNKQKTNIIIIYKIDFKETYYYTNKKMLQLNLLTIAKFKFSDINSVPAHAQTVAADRCTMTAL